jgi:hypothetical protein
MNLTTDNNMTPEVSASEAQLPTTDNVAKHSDPSFTSTTPPMHSLTAGEAKERGMSRALFATPLADRQAITAALLRGFNDHQGIRTEDALSAVGFTWPMTASPRSLGAIVSMLARTGQIVETGWTKGRSGRSRAGRVSLWVKVTP